MIKGAAGVMMTSEMAKLNWRITIEFHGFTLNQKIHKLMQFSTKPMKKVKLMKMGMKLLMGCGLQPVEFSVESDIPRVCNLILKTSLRDML